MLRMSSRSAGIGAVPGTRMWTRTGWDAADKLPSRSAPYATTLSIACTNICFGTAPTI